MKTPDKDGYTTIVETGIVRSVTDLISGSVLDLREALFNLEEGNGSTDLEYASDLIRSVIQRLE